MVGSADGVTIWGEPHNKTKEAPSQQQAPAGDERQRELSQPEQQQQSARPTTALTRRLSLHLGRLKWMQNALVAMPKSQAERQRREELSYSYHPESAEGRALRRYQEGSSEQDCIVLDEGNQETTEPEIEQAVQRLKTLGVKTKD